jgi:CubicO group peptidase (beta-lactamase class C family)
MFFRVLGLMYWPIIQHVLVWRKIMRQKIIIYSLILTLLASLSSGCLVEPTRINQNTYWPAQEWKTSTPEEQGLNSAQLLALLHEIQRQDLKIHSVLIVRHGYLVTEVYFPPYQKETKHPLFSGTKSVTSMLVGKALQEGQLKSVQQKVLDFFPDIAREVTDPMVPDLTVEHLLTMSAGFNTNTMPDLTSTAARAGTIKHILTYDSILQKPGTTFFYDSGLPHLLSGIVQKTTGTTLQAYAQQKLFEPLGISEVSWAADPQGVTTGNTGLMMRPLDLAKLGYLYLQGGRWNGTQVVPANWVDASTTKHIETKGLMNAAEDSGYGYLWWMNGFDGYAAHGFGGQYLFVLPQADMVVVFTGGLPDPAFPAPQQLLQAYVLPAIKSAQPLPANPQAFRALENQIQGIEHPEQPVAPLPEMAHRISGKTFRITQGAPAEAWFQAVTFTFEGGTTYQSESQWPGDQRVSIKGGLNNLFQLNPLQFKGFQPTDEVLVALRGHWQDDHTFVEEYVRDMNSDIAFITQKSTFEGNRVVIELTSSMHPYLLQALGEMTQ